MTSFAVTPSNRISSLHKQAWCQSPSLQPTPRGRGGFRSVSEATAVDGELPHLVVDDPLRTAQEASRLGAVSARALERVQNQILLVLLHCFAERLAHLCVGRLGRLKRRR